MAKKKNVAKRGEKKDKYTANVKVLGKTFTAHGTSVQEAISKLDVGVARGRAILAVTHGDVTKERILGVVQAVRLFNTAGFTKAVALKNVSLLFEGI